MTLWITPDSPSDHPKGRQRGDSCVHTCLHFYRKSYTSVCMSMSEAGNENVEQKQEGTGTSGGACLKAVKKNG